MKTIFIVSVIALLATAAFAVNQESEENPGQTNGSGASNPIRDIFYDQEPHSLYLKVNASTGFQTEVADDIPTNLDGSFIGQIGLYVGEWNGDWVDPDGIFVKLYNGNCPPDMEPYNTMYFNWGDPNHMTYEFVAGGLPNSHQAYVTLFLPEIIQISAPMSIGFVVDNSWGESSPYCGLVYCDTSEDFYGQCLGYKDQEAFGHPRWTEAYDLAYGLDDEFVVSTEDGSWGSVKALYR